MSTPRVYSLSLLGNREIGPIPNIINGRNIMGTEKLSQKLTTFWKELPVGQEADYKHVCNYVDLVHPTERERANVAGFLSKLVRWGHAKKEGKRPNTQYKKVRPWNGVMVNSDVIGAVRTIQPERQEFTSGEIGESILKIIDLQNEVIKHMKEEKKEMAGEIRSLVESYKKCQERVQELQQNQAKGGRKVVSLHDLQEQIREG